QARGLLHGREPVATTVATPAPLRIRLGIGPGHAHDRVVAALLEAGLLPVAGIEYAQQRDALAAQRRLPAIDLGKARVLGAAYRARGGGQRGGALEQDHAGQVSSLAAAARGDGAGAVAQAGDRGGGKAGKGGLVDAARGGIAVPLGRGAADALVQRLRDRVAPLR